MIVVTGGAGFIGSNIVAHFEEERRSKISVCDWFGASDKWRNVAKRNISLLVDPNQVGPFLDAHVDDISAIVHMGAISSTTAANVDKLIALNVRSTIFLWDWCADHGIPFIYASSAAVYGDSEQVLNDDNTPAGVAGLRPLNPYGWTKKIVDQLFIERTAAGEKTPPQWVGLRFFNVYGPNEYHKDTMRSVAAKLFDAAQTGNTVQLFKSDRQGIRNGEQRRDFVYVKDCCKAISWFIDNPKVSGIFNLGTGSSQSFLEVTRALGRALNRDLDIEFIDMPETIKSKYQYLTEADMGRARTAGMSFNFMPIEDGVMDYVERYLLSADRYR